MFLERNVCLIYVLLHYLYQSQTSDLFLFITFLANLEANLQNVKKKKIQNDMLQMLFLQTILKDVLILDWSLTVGMEVLKPSAGQRPPGGGGAAVTNRLATSMLCIGSSIKKQASLPSCIVVKHLREMVRGKC